jgi:adenylate cyclase
LDNPSHPEYSEMPLDQDRQLQLVLAMDHVRDMLHDDENPHHMFDKLATLLKEQFQADACAIMLVAETSEDEIEALAHVGLPESIAIQMCRQAIQYHHVTPLPDAALPNTVGIQIFLDDFPMGAVVLSREAKSFDESELALLKLAEGQLDSAVAQARTIWKLSQRNRELEAIYQIDVLRDQTNSETDLISGFTQVILDHFEADFCLVLLSQAETGDMVIRGIIDKRDLPASVLEQIRDQARDLKMPQVIPTPAAVNDGMMLLAAPFIVGNDRVGGIVVGRKTAFTVSDHRLLHAMMTQMDSAIVHSRASFQLSQRKQELEVIYKIDRIRDSEKDLDALLQNVLTEICGVVSSEMGYIMLYNDHNKAGDEQELELRSFTMDDLLTSPEYLDVVHQVSRQALDAGKMIYANEPHGPIHSIVAVPLILHDHIIGVFGAVNSTHSKGFDADDRRLLAAITSQIDTAIFERMEQRRMRALLSRSVDPKVLEHFLQNADTNVLAGERVVITVLFADLRGSTEWAEHTDPEELVKTLNTFLSQMTDVIFKYGGTLDKFVGDEVIGLFGTPVKMEDHAYRAACTALEMQVIHYQLQATLRAQGHELPAMGVGVSSGEAIAGEFGHPVRSEFTALGRIVNLGSRLCSAAQGGQVLISEATYDMIRPLATANNLGSMGLKGISQPTTVYELTHIEKGA